MGVDGVDATVGVATGVGAAAEFDALAGVAGVAGFAAGAAGFGAAAFGAAGFFTAGFSPQPVWPQVWQPVLRQRFSLQAWRPVLSPV